MAATVQIENSIAAPDTVPSLRANFRWTFAGNVIYALCQWGMLSVLAKLGNAAVVGQFALALAISAPVFMFTNLQLRGVQATDAKSEYGFADYATLRLLATAIGLSAIVLITIGLPYDWATRSVILIVALAKAFECCSDVIAGLLQKHERLDRVAVSLMIRGIGSLVVFAGIFAYSRSLLEAVAAMAAVWLAVLATYDLHWATRFAGAARHFLALDWTVLRHLFVLSLPLGLVMTLISLNVNIPRYLLEHYLGTANLGIFASLAYLVVALNLVVNALGQSASTRLAHMFAERRLSEFRRLVLKLSMLGVLVIAIGVPVALACGRPILTILYRPEYGDYSGVLALMVAAAGLSSIGSFLGYGITSARKFRQQVPLISCSTFIAILGSWLLIPRMGLMGAAFALLLSAGVFTAGAFLILHGALASAKKLA
jgi:O-antigen/teichoic acid export membrane protein